MDYSGDRQRSRSPSGQIRREPGVNLATQLGARGMESRRPRILYRCLSPTYQFPMLIRAVRRRVHGGAGYQNKELESFRSQPALTIYKDHVNHDVQARHERPGSPERHFQSGVVAYFLAFIVSPPYVAMRPQISEAAEQSSNPIPASAPPKAQVGRSPNRMISKALIIADSSITPSDCADRGKRCSTL